MSLAYNRQALASEFLGLDSAHQVQTLMCLTNVDSGLRRLGHVIAPQVLGDLRIRKANLTVEPLPELVERLEVMKNKANNL